MDTAGESSGLHEYFTKVHYQIDGNTKPQETEVRFRLDVPDKKVVVKPRAIIVYQLTSEPTTQTVTLTDFRKVPKFDVLAIHKELDSVSVTEPVVQQDEYGHHQIHFEVTVSGEVPAGRQTDSLLIRTSDAEFPEIKVPLLLYGPQDDSQSASR